MRGDTAGVELLDSDGELCESGTLKNGLVRIFWKRYEIESYLIHPDAIVRFTESVGGETAAEKARAYMNGKVPPDVFKYPMRKHEYLEEVKAKNILSGIFHGVGIPEAKDYSQIAAVMKKEEIHPEVVEKLDRVADCLGIEKE